MVLILPRYDGNRARQIAGLTFHVREILVRTLTRAAIAFVLAVVSFVGPVSAATSSTVVGQAMQATSAIAGRVTDARSAGIGNAAITITGNGRSYSATTAGDGSFSVSLLPGVYSVVVNKGGFTTATNDEIVVGTNAKITLAIALQEDSLSSLRVIGRTGSSVNRTPFNTSETTVSALPAQQIAERQPTNLTDLIGTLPGVTIQRTFSSTPNTNFTVRGGQLQTRVTIDGHPISSGISGQWNTNYAAAGIFENVEIIKGAGLNGSIAGESAVGTVNLRTRDFSAQNSSGFQLGLDNFSGSQYNAFADVNLLNNRLSLIVAKAFTGFRGAADGDFADRTNTSSGAGFPSIAPGLGQIPAVNSLDQWQGDLSNRYSLEGELVKARYRLSNATSITGEFLGLQGQYAPQGGSYATYNGKNTLQACFVPAGRGGAFQSSLSTCTASSIFEPPYEFGNIGNTVDSYTWFPNSVIQNNEPQFAAELRTTYKNDTILLRPYTHLINRFINGTLENQYPGNGGGWYAVTNAANCQVRFLAPGTVGGPATGAAGPCFGTTGQYNSLGYVGGDATPHVFATSGAAPAACATVAPFTCFTTPTSTQNNGLYGYATPFSQPELDRLNGYTFSYIHPVGDNIYNLSYDYRKDFTQSSSTDQSGLGAGCNYVIGSVKGFTNAGVPNFLDNTGQPFQPNCSTAQTPVASPYAQYNLLPRSAIGTPPTVSQFSDVALTAQVKINEQLRLAIGDYYELYRADAQIEDPAILAAYAARGNSQAAPVSFVTRKLAFAHNDPHIGLEYRATNDLSLRLNGGSSVTNPYASLISGFGSVSIPNAANHNYTNNLPNPDLQPETTVAYNVGFDYRTPNGSVLAVDAFTYTTYNSLIQTSQVIPAIGGIQTFPDTLFLNTRSVNAGQYKAQGLEMTLSKLPTLGFGYYLTGTLERAYLDQIPLSAYSGNTTAGNSSFNVNGAQIFGIPFFKSYGQLVYRGLKGTQVSIGADYQGNNNSTFSNPYTVFDAGLKVPISDGRMSLQFAANNLFNYGDGTALGRNLVNQGAIQPKVYLPLGASTLSTTGASSSLQAIAPRTIRVLLNYAMGR